ncbi:MAG: YjbH domain-containing protein [Sporomusaceae bacterium]|nr:YjbH domain-containing protein [Sporomusaceae bacterium]
MKRMFPVLLCALFLSTASAAAAPSFGGPTGLINTPSADALREGQFSLGYHRLHEQKAASFSLNIMPNVEAGIVRIFPDAGSNQTMFHTKWSVAPETVVTPGFAVGVEGLGDGRSSAYAVVSKGLPLGLRLHAGVGNGRFDGAFGAIEATFSPAGGLTGPNVFPTTTLIAEYDGDSMNYGARLALVPGLKLEAGWRDSRTYVGASFTY